LLEKTFLSIFIAFLVMLVLQMKWLHKQN